MPYERLKPSFVFNEERLNQLKQVAPEAFVDGKINWDVLKEALGEYAEDESQEAEHFGLFWPGKREARKLASIPSKGTLVPVKGEGIDEEKTRNIFIEGENLEVLKLIQKSYAGKIKMIYIDPPYNTGNDFVYDDNFTEPLDEYLKYTGQMDEEGKLLTTNKKADGRFHSKWLSMMYPRLRLARNLLKDEGVIFLSIGEVEVGNLEKLLNELFGEENKVSIIARVAKTASDKGNFFAPSIDFVLCYARNIEKLALFKDKVDESLYTKIESGGPKKGERYRDDVALYQSSLDTRPNQKYFITCPDGSRVIPPCSHLDEIARPGDGVWRWSKETCEKNKDLLVFKKTKTSPLLTDKGEKANWNIYTKSYLNDRQERGTRPRNYLEEFINRKGADLLKRYDIYFDYSKPVELVRYFLDIIDLKDDDVVLDFFAGSATTAHSVLEKNVEDTARFKFIMVQFPEALDEETAKLNKGAKTICDIGKERIRRVIKKIRKEHKIERVDLGFKVLKLEKSNFKQWQDYQGKDLKELQQVFEHWQSPLIDGWKEENLLIEILLQDGFPLDSNIEQLRQYSKNKILQVSSEFCEHKLLVCLDKKVYQETINDLALGSDDRFICLDNALNDEQKVRLSDKGFLKTI